MNYKFLAKNGLNLAFGLAVIGILITLIPVFSGLGPFNELADEPNIRSVAEEGNIFKAGIYTAFGLGVLAFGLALVLSLVGVFSNLKASKMSLIAFAVLAILFFALYASTNTDLTPEMSLLLENPDYKMGDDLGKYKWISAGINGTLILMAIAFLSMIVMEFWNFFKNS